MYFIVILSNKIFKNLIFKPIYNLFNVSKISILGLGPRPKGANSCRFTLDNVLSTTYGMPSGHSQIAWTVATYILFTIVYNFNNNKYENTNNNIKTLNYIWFFTSCILIIWIAFYISYSRVYIEGCHTLQQVIVGGLIGIVSGFLVYYYENNIKKMLKF
jgi:membrane-associated phospholipid phosphatase